VGGNYLKKIILLVISSVLLLGLFTACSTHKESNTLSNKKQISTNIMKKDIREMAFNQLNSNDKERIRGSWKDSRLSKITLKENMGRINNKSYIGKEVYLIDFQTKGGVQSNLIVYLAIDNNKLIGYGYTD
jgi:hypothetical protein